jgi:hypothetical protein
MQYPFCFWWFWSSPGLRPSPSWPMTLWKTRHISWTKPSCWRCVNRRISMIHWARGGSKSWAVTKIYFVALATVLTLAIGRAAFILAFTGLPMYWQDGWRVHRGPPVAGLSRSGCKPADKLKNRKRRHSPPEIMVYCGTAGRSRLSISAAFLCGAAFVASPSSRSGQPVEPRVPVNALRHAQGERATTISQQDATDPHNHR